MGNEASYKFGKGLPSWKSGSAYSVTFIVTEECNLRCKYCYQVHKNNKKDMTFETAKKAIDYLLDNPDIFDADAVMWDFIGGEPLLKIDLINQICDYIKLQTFRKKHKWFANCRFSIGTNGVLYNSDSVKEFIRKNREKCSMGITIDGTKVKHDLQRVYKDGRGSYEDVFENVKLWLKDFPDGTTKVTFGHEDLKYLKESIIHLWSLGMEQVPANVVFEDAWEEGDDVIYEEQLKGLADYVIDNHLWDKVNTTLFDTMIGFPEDEHGLSQNFCGSGRMLAIDADGNFYPCLRFAEYSLGDKKPIIFGNPDDGMDIERIRPFLALSTRAQSSEECINCEIAKGCAWCQGNNYDCSENCTIYHRATYICKMHKARVRANNYYWDKLRRITGITREYEGERRQHLYFITSDDAVEHCNYISKETSTNIMSDEVIKKGMEYCSQNFYKPVILHSKNQENIKNINELAINEKIDICQYGINIPYMPETACCVMQAKDVDNMPEMDVAILKFNVEDMDNLADTVNKMMQKCKRIVLNIINNTKGFPIDAYKVQLEKISEELKTYLVRNVIREVNVLTDRIYIDKMDNCNAGVHNFALAPNGKLYMCPAFYYNDPESYVGDLETGVDKKRLEQCQLDKAPICAGCDAYQCNRCVFEHAKYTGEYNTPTSFECKKSHIEREVTVQLLKAVKQENPDIYEFDNIESVDYLDPLDKIVEQLDVNPYARHYC